MTVATAVLLAGIAAAGSTPSPDLGPGVMRGNIVRVNIVGTPAQNGAALLDAMAAITGNSISNPFLVQIGPGTFDIGSATLNLKPYVSVEGAGRLSTIIEGAARATPSAIVAGANWTGEIRRLVIGCGGSAPYAIALDVTGMPSTRLQFRDLFVVAGGGTSSSIAVRIAGPSIDMANVDVFAEGANARGMVLQGWTHVRDGLVQVFGDGATEADGVRLLSASSGSMERFTVSVSGGLVGSVLRVENSTDFRLDDATLAAVGSSGSAGVRAIESHVTARRLDSTASAIGYVNQGGSLILEDSRVAGPVGISNVMGAGTPGLAIRSSTVAGTPAISSPTSGFVTIALSQIAGPIVAAGTVRCTLSYDENNESPGLNVCP